MSSFSSKPAGGFHSMIDVLFAVRLARALLRKERVARRAMIASTARPPQAIPTI